MTDAEVALACTASFFAGGSVFVPAGGPLAIMVIASIVCAALLFIASVARMGVQDDTDGVSLSTTGNDDDEGTNHVGR